MAADEPLPTRTDWIDRRLKEAILTGELGAGQKVKAVELSRLWGVSQTPLREAIQRLAGRGLIEQSPQRGARVYKPTHQDAREIYQLRLVIDPLALSTSLANSDAIHKRQMQASYRAMESNSPLATAHEFSRAAHAEAHLAFHGALMSRCTSHRLLQLTHQLAEQSLLYQAIRPAEPDGRGPARTEHRELLRLAVRGEIKEATALLRKHLTRAMRIIEFALKDAEKAESR